MSEAGRAGTEASTMAVDIERERARAEAALEAAAAARGQADHAAREAALRQAVEAASAIDDAPLLHTAAWRLAKARADAGEVAGVLAALAPLLERTHVRTPGLVSVREAVGPFDHYAPGLRAWPQVARRHADRLGYADPALPALWDAWIAKQDALGAPFLAWWGRGERAWLDAATGGLDAVARRAAEASRLRVTAFDGDTHAHPKARTPDESPGWLALDLARTLLQAALWADEARAADDARDQLLDAAEELGVRPELDLWTLDVLLRAEERFGLAGDRRDLPRYRALAGEASVPRTHAARARAFLARRAGDGATAAAEARRAATAAHEDHAGPEWIVEALREALEAGDEAARAEAEAAMARTGVRMALR